MSPTVFRYKNAKFYFFSREKSRMHIHVLTPDGEAKFWMAPDIELATTIKLKAKELNRLKKIVEEHRDEIIRTWQQEQRKR
jgi:hypothetical protein